MTASKATSGVGVRYGIVFLLDTDGLPVAGVSGADTPVQGTVIERIKTYSPTAPAPQRFTHFGEDRPYAQDSLPPTDGSTFIVTTAQSDMRLDEVLGGAKLRSIGAFQHIAVNHSDRGNEPQVMFATYRQELDTLKGSSTMGTKRQWKMFTYPSCRIAPSTVGFEQGLTDKTYEATPTSVSKTQWGEALTAATDGVTESEAFEDNFDYHPRLNFYLSDGSKTAYSLSHPPVSSTYLNVFRMDTGAAVTVSTVDTSATNPAFTLAAPVAATTKLMAIIATNAPGNT